MTPDGRLMGATVDGRGPVFDVEAPMLLQTPPFASTSGPFVAQYDASDGRFVMTAFSRDLSLTPITLLFDWEAPAP